MKAFGIKKTYERLNKMLDDGIRGSFRESDYDESELSKLETKWLRYLSASKLSQQKVEKERAEIKELVTDISHQTQTPLANIMLYTQLLQEEELEGNSRQLVGEIQKQSEKLEFLIRSLVKLSRMETGILKLTPKEKDVRGLVDKAISQVQQQAKEKEISITMAGKTACTAIFDEKWTAEALGNLLDNAIKYTPAGGDITVEVRPYEMFTCIAVMDNGMGIAEDELPKVFGRFYRGRDVADMEGVGIGLYLVREIMESQNGYVKVESKLGEGSEFQLFLPQNFQNC